MSRSYETQGRSNLTLKLTDLFEFMFLILCRVKPGKNTVTHCERLTIIQIFYWFFCAKLKDVQNSHLKENTDQLKSPI